MNLLKRTDLPMASIFNVLYQLEFALKFFLDRWMNLGVGKRKRAEHLLEFWNEVHERHHWVIEDETLVFRRLQQGAYGEVCVVMRYDGINRPAQDGFVDGAVHDFKRVAGCDVGTREHVLRGGKDSIIRYKEPGSYESPDAVAVALEDRNNSALSIIDEIESVALGSTAPMSGSFSAAGHFGDLR